MPSLAVYPAMMQRDRQREGLRICRAAWLIGVTVREYREMEAGDRGPSSMFGTGSASYAGGPSRS
jgi:hypothetical protein